MEIVLDNLGFFTEREIETLKRRLTGKTFMKFEIGCGKSGGGNCTLIIKTKYPGTEDSIKNFFLSYVLTELACQYQLNEKEEN